MRRPKKVLLLGAGGMGMAPLAFYLKGAGVRVEAFDDHFREPLRSQMEKAGIVILDEPEPIVLPECVIHSSAINQSHEMVKKWEKLGIPVYRRGTFIAQLFARKKVIAVVGSHGKSSVAGRLAWVLKNLNFPASFLIGAQFVNGSMMPGEFHKSPWVVLEVDESDGTIDEFSPTITVSLNCDWDHVDQYQNKESFRATLNALFSRTKQCIVCPNKEPLLTMAKKVNPGRLIPFSPVDIDHNFNQSNASAVKAVITFLGISDSGLDLENFPGLDRRQTILFNDGSRCVVEDYAHHPTEVHSFLDFRRKMEGSKSMKVVFQPHRYSRTKRLAQGFAEELAIADQLFLLPTYSAYEKFDESGTVETLTGYLPPRLRESTRIYEDFGDLRRSLRREDNPRNSDQVLFVGAGDISVWARAFSAWECSGEDKYLAFGRFLNGRLCSSTSFTDFHPIGSMTTMGVGGDARWYAEPANIEDLKSLVEACKLFELPRAVMGRGSNLIIPDDGFGGLVLRLRGKFWSTIELRNENTLIVGAGAKLKDICKLSCEKGLKGFEFLEGIPGTLGGALRMNAGAMGWEMFDLVEWVSFLLPDGKIQKILGSELEVGYRYCKEAYEGIALRAKLKAEGKAKHQEIRNVIDKLASARRKTQPREASSGCIFRNPSDKSAGWLIDQCGLKGERVGNAGISNLHANFILNHGDATAGEVIELIQTVRDRVKKSHGLSLEPEVNLLGQEWEQFLS
jgi:UDP-N-acetylenolpyruvoylglucosamine reductase